LASGGLILNFFFGGGGQKRGCRNFTGDRGPLPPWNRPCCGGRRACKGPQMSGKFFWLYLKKIRRYNSAALRYRDGSQEKSCRNDTTSLNRALYLNVVSFVRDARKTLFVNLTIDWFDKK